MPHPPDSQVPGRKPCDPLVERHQRQEEDQANDRRMPSCYSSPQSIDAWRHARQIALVVPLIAGFPGCTWLTLGDGGFGSDAHQLRRAGADATASSLTDHSLRIAHGLGHIGPFLALDACHIALPENAYDFVFCKEALHHLSRPPLALYEMLRVARHGVVLLEPQTTGGRPLDRLKSWIKTHLRRDRHLEYETSGNYIYRYELGEIIRLARALDLPGVAYRRYNDFFLPQIARRTDRIGWLLQHAGLGFQNLLAGCRLMDYGLMATVLCKTETCVTETQARLRRTGFRCLRLPRNPYLASPGGPPRNVVS